MQCILFLLHWNVNQITIFSLLHISFYIQFWMVHNDSKHVAYFGQTL